MLVGQYEHNINQKNGRVFIPAKLREDIGETFVMSVGLDDRFLCIYSLEEWANLQRQVDGLPLASVNAVRRFLHANAAELQPDAQGRVCIPQNLRDYARLTETVVIAGVSNHIEIWDKESWEKTQAATSPESIMEILGKLNG